MLTVECSGCAAFGPPARPPGSLPGKEDRRRTAGFDPFRRFACARSPDEELAADARQGRRATGCLRLRDIVPAAHAAEARRRYRQRSRIAARTQRRRPLRFEVMFRRKSASIGAAPQRSCTRGCRRDARSPALAVLHPFTSTSRQRAHSLAVTARDVRRGPAAKRFHNGQQNAHRRDPSGGNPGGRAARQSRRGIRFRVRATASSFAAISISPRSRGSSRRCRPPSSTMAATATASWRSAKSIPTIIRSRSPTGRR